MNEIETKRCKCCNKDKDETEFKTGFSGYKRKICIECMYKAAHTSQSRMCPKCKKEKKEESFRFVNTILYRRKICIECEQENKRLRWKIIGKRPEERKKRRTYQLKHLYGLTQEEYESLVKMQNAKCAICGKDKSEPLNVDHDHTTLIIRGLLCRECNRAIGFFGDDPKNLIKASEYLKRNQSTILSDYVKNKIPF